MDPGGKREANGYSVHRQPKGNPKNGESAARFTEHSENSRAEAPRSAYTKKRRRFQRGKRRRRAKNGTKSDASIAGTARESLSEREAVQRRHNRQSQEGERLLKENSCKEPRKRSEERNGEKNGRSAEERDPGRPTARKGPWARRIPRKPLAEASERGEGDPAGMAAAFRKEKSSERTSASAQGRFSREGRETEEKTEGAGKRDTRSEKGPQSVKEQDRKRRETHSSGSQTQRAKEIPQTDPAGTSKVALS